MTPNRTTSSTPSSTSTRRAPSSSGAAQAEMLARVMAALPRVVDLLAARAEEQDREADFPYQGVETLHAAGLLTVTVAERHGGPAAGLAQTVGLLAALGSGDPSVALLAAETLLVHAAEDRSPRWPSGAYQALLAESKRGPALAGTLRSRSGVRAERTADGWQLTGHEPSVPGAEALHWMTVEAVVAEDRSAATFLLPGDAPGLIIEPGTEQFGLRARAVQDVGFEDVVLDDEARLEARLAASSRWDEAARRLAVAAVAVGVASSARAWLRRSIKELPLAELGRLEVELAESEELLTALARSLDAADPVGDPHEDLNEAPSVDRNAGASDATRRVALLAPRVAERALGIVRHCVDLSGAQGLTRGWPLERQLRDAVSLRALLPREDVLLAEAGRSLG
ncbi:acyl-CoA dehydrogenase family protein [Streptacidiphilus fuscans]|uniref:Acyl-CoA/acyl-ACP dehydrogenase n=1 Tax=Streptacidiphilus fuscans TaxID=2789292 RepID=A0A931FDU4_9ACTN|nr:acyl-CoA dehydrogenase family protein [Streptacidiphilus fuscans]MBF9069933.1 acyl-CoA/acyl-ACP dehydrogenase [Streptacidiphilus fuscans]